VKITFDPAKREATLADGGSISPTQQWFLRVAN
jgi:hypothetical protein